jgi:UDP-2-acetamido-2-deoxy-ribo-hexuluronate aminotransferase
LGWNSRLDEIQASIANLKLNYLDEWNNRYLELAKFYIEELRGVVELPSINKFEKPVFHRFIIQHEKRDSLKIFLESKGIQTAINYPLPLHLHQASEYLGYKVGDFPMAEKQAKKILSIPIYPELKKIESQYVVQCIKAFFKNN